MPSHVGIKPGQPAPASGQYEVVGPRGGHTGVEVMKGGESMSFDFALIKEQGVTFAVVVVKEHVVQSTAVSEQAIRAFQPYFPGVPVVLAGRTYRGLKYYGRRDLVKFLANVPVTAIPWKRYRGH
jgi:hypothetical protein